MQDPTDICLGNLKYWDDLDYNLILLIDTYNIISLKNCLCI